MSDFETSLTVAQEAMENLSLAALRYLCETARAQYPTAVTILLDESDQGDWMTYSALLDAAGEEIEDPVTGFDDEGTVSNLYIEGWGSAWQAHADRGEGTRRGGYSWSVDIDRVLREVK